MVIMFWLVSVYSFIEQLICEVNYAIIVSEGAISLQNKDIWEIISEGCTYTSPQHLTHKPQERL